MTDSEREQLQRQVEALREVVSGQQAAIAVLVSTLHARRLLSQEEAALILTACVQGQKDKRGEERILCALAKVTQTPSAQT